MKHTLRQLRMKMHGRNWRLRPLLMLWCFAFSVGVTGDWKRWRLPVNVPTVESDATTEVYGIEVTACSCPLDQRVLREAMNSLPTGGTLRLRGNFVLSNTLLIDRDNLTLEGSPASFRWAGLLPHDGPMFSITGHQIEVRNLIFYDGVGTGFSDTAGDWLSMYETSEAKLTSTTLTTTTLTLPDEIGPPGSVMLTNANLATSSVYLTSETGTGGVVMFANTATGAATFSTAGTSAEFWPAARLVKDGKGNLRAP